MISPLAVATGGWLTQAPLPIASDGYLFLAGDVIEEVTPVGGGGSRRKVAWRDSVLGQRLLREDDEILAIIMAATRTLQ